MRGGEHQWKWREQEPKERKKKQIQLDGGYEKKHSLLVLDLCFIKAQSDRELDESNAATIGG